MNSGALVLFSGGQDSTTCLAWALSRYDHVETVAFRYGQRHAIELECRKVVLNSMRKRFPRWDRKLGMDHEVDAGVLGQLSDTALTREKAIEVEATGLPNTFVPGRNILFFTLAGAVAYRRGLHVLVGGMCETDFSGYPDCRDNTIKAMQVALSLGMEMRLSIETPLMWLSKGETWTLAEELGGAGLVEIIRDDTHTCYLGDRSKKAAWGHGCGDCPACDLRKKGFESYMSARASVA